MTDEISAATMTAIIIAVVWELLWKAMALWRAARRNERAWFYVLLFVNTVGVLPIIYLLTHKDNGGAPGKPQEQ